MENYLVGSDLSRCDPSQSFLSITPSDLIDYRTQRERRRGPGAGLSQGLLHDTPDTWYLCNSPQSFRNTDLKGLSTAIKADRNRRGEGRGRREVSFPVSATNPGSTPPITGACERSFADIHHLCENLRLIK